MFGPICGIESAVLMLDGYSHLGRDCVLDLGRKDKHLFDLEVFGMTMGFHFFRGCAQFQAQNRHLPKIASGFGNSFQNRRLA